MLILKSLIAFHTGHLNQQNWFFLFQKFLYEIEDSNFILFLKLSQLKFEKYKKTLRTDLSQVMCEYHGSIDKEYY